MSIRQAGLALLFLAGSVGTAQAASMTFDNVSGVFDEPYVEDGLAVICVTGCPGTNSQLFSFGAGDQYTADKSGTSSTLTNNWSGATLAIQRAAGGTFDLISVDFADAYDSGAPYLITLGWDGGGTTITLDNIPGLETITLNLLGITFFSWRTDTGPDRFAQIDNVNAVSTVPIPAALPLLMSALAGMGFVGWRKRQAAGDR